MKAPQTPDPSRRQKADQAHDVHVSDEGEAAVSRYKAPLSPEDAALDARWRAAFGQPLPLLGAGEIVRTILAEQTANEHKQKR